MLKNKPKGFTTDVTCFITAQAKTFRKVLGGSLLQTQYLEIRKPSLVLGFFGRQRDGGVVVLVWGLKFGFWFSVF